jgi:hypothetical protein
MSKLISVFIAGLLGYLFIGQANAYTITQIVGIGGNGEQGSHAKVPNLIPTFTDEVIGLTISYDVIATIYQSAYTSPLQQPLTSYVVPKIQIDFYSVNTDLHLTKSALVIVPVEVSNGKVSITGSARFTDSIYLGNILTDSEFLIDFAVSNQFGFLPGIILDRYSDDEAFASGTLSLTYTLVPEPATFALLGLGVVALGIIRRQQN